MDFEVYRNRLNERISKIAKEEKIKASRVFLEDVLNLLLTFDVLDDYNIISMIEGKGKDKGETKSGTRNIGFDGYVFDDTDHSLIMFITDYTENYRDEQLNNEAIDQLYWKMYYLLEIIGDGKYREDLIENSEAYNAAKLISSRLNTVLNDSQRILKIHFYIFTNKELSTKLLDKDLFSTTTRTTKKKKKTPKKAPRIKKKDFLGRPLDIELWTIERFYEIEDTNSIEPIEIDFYNDFNSEGIPCLKGALGNGLDYDAYIGIIPGKLLADIYNEYGSRVLEGNVRAFLGTKSAKGVNSGIKRTINNEPTKFFTYNNGIAATASGIELDNVGGQLYITNITDFQIINGGQTTATLAEAVLKQTNPSLAGIFVPIKLTVISDREKVTEDGVLYYDKLIHDIARYANSQNKVTAADLFSNDPFHIWMEQVSKKYLAPTVKYNIQTGWYYERTRKKYDQEQLKRSNDTEKLNRFLHKFPKNQIIKKEELALYLTAINKKPYLCSKGKNYVMKEFGVMIGETYKKDKSAFNEYYFKKCICAAIIYRKTDFYLEKNKWDSDFWYKPGGYKGNIVPYTISRIIDLIPPGYTLDWNYIWNNQDISEAFFNEIKRLTFLTNNYFCGLTGVLVSEHCKKETTWEDYKANVPYELSTDFKTELITCEEDKRNASQSRSEQKDVNELQLISNIIAKGAIYWKELLTKGKAKNLLIPSEISRLNDIITFVNRGNIPMGRNGKVPSKIMALINDVITIEGKLNDEGLIDFGETFEADDDVVVLNIDNYKIHK